MIRLLYFGTPAIAVQPLQALQAAEGIEIIGVVTAPLRPVGRHQTLTPSPVHVAADALGLPVYHAERKKDVLQLLQTLSCDIAVVIAFGVIFPEEALTLPLHGILNVHFSLLPAYRGASPVQSALLQGDTESGITVQRMAYAMDTGDVLYQEAMSLQHHTTATAWDAMSTMTAEVLPEIVAEYCSGLLTPMPQDDSAASYCGKFTRADGEVDCTTHTAEQILRKYRAFTPWPGVYIEAAMGPVKLLSISPSPEEDAVPISCAGGTQLYLRTLQIPGKTPAPAMQVLRSYPFLFSTPAGH
ncbi:methionyl-tRNA formyltransferase [Candidatus Peribacteria bacterium]|nr:methionyl-tRNA formyltransferase [Candidatus Peribacteria bacterium]